MEEMVIKKRLAVLGILLVAVLGVWWPEFDGVKFRPIDALSSLGVLGTPACDPTLLCVAFLDVGQGDAIYVQSPSGQQLLIDGGRDQSVLRELGEVMSFFDRDIDFVLATHPDADHIGGLVSVLERYNVGNIIKTENESNSALSSRFTNLGEIEGVQIHFARRGQRYDLGGGVFLDILFPDTNASTMESNTSSIVARLVYDETSFLLTGDSPKAIEEYLVLIEGEYLKSDVLKVGHHGSRTSTAEMFLDEVSPQYAVISAGADNSYGHPHLEVTDALFNAGVTTLNTGEVGRIVFWSDGQSLELR